MSVIKRSPFESQYGFKSPSFSVDENGNITATSITVADEEDTGVIPADFTVTETTGGGSFVFTGTVTGNDPQLTLSRGSRYIFDINLTVLDFTIFNSDATSFLSTGLTHSDGTSGAEANTKKTGRLILTVGASAPDTLYYGASTFPTRNLITVTDPNGSFNNVTINSTADSLNSLTGALTVAGGVGIKKSLHVGDNIHSNALYSSNIISSENLIINAANGVEFLTEDSTRIGLIDSAGSTIPLVNTTIENTSIGLTTPAQAAFTSATVDNSPTTGTSVTNKTYVDNSITALSIALGM